MHGVAHTGKLARAVVLDLALLDQTGEAAHWERAVSRAGWVAGRLAPDPEHGALIYHPGRLDPRNCSTSAIDSGECTDALARLLLHSRAETLDDETRRRLIDAVERNAGTYLLSAALEKGITNQRMWAAMGLAAAWALLRRDEWVGPLEQSVRRALEEQQEDGSWSYQPNAVAEGAHPGAADLTVYYHSRCIAFLQHIAASVPALDTPELSAAIERALDFQTLVMAPDGLKPLTLEGKRWFWDGTYEAGSAAYDVYALLSGAAGRDELRGYAHAAWRQLARHQRHDGAIVACLEPANADFVCPDFHTADLAWTAQVMADLPDPEAPATAPTGGPSTSHASAAGVNRLQSATRVVWIRNKKQPANALVGGVVGGGAPAAVTDQDGARLLQPDEARCRLFPRWSPAIALSGLGRFWRANRPRREGSQALFVARLLAQQGRPGAALRRLWQLYFGPLIESLRDPASPDWATSERGVTRPDGSTPGWAAGLEVGRECTLEDETVRVRLTLSGAAPGAQRIEYMLPAAARDVQVESEGLDVERRGKRVMAQVWGGAALRVDVTYRL